MILSFVVAVLVFPLSDLLPDNCRQALSLGQHVDIFEHQSVGLFEWFTPVTPVRIVISGQCFPNALSQVFIENDGNEFGVGLVGDQIHILAAHRAEEIHSVQSPQLTDEHIPKVRCFREPTSSNTRPIGELSVGRRRADKTQ